MNVSFYISQSHNFHSRFYTFVLYPPFGSEWLPLEHLKKLSGTNNSAIGYKQLGNRVQTTAKADTSETSFV